MRRALAALAVLALVAPLRAEDANPFHVLTVTVNLPGPGGVSTEPAEIVSRPPGIRCQAWQTCSAVFPHGVVVRLTGRSPKLRVVGFAGAACLQGTNTGETCAVLMDASKYEQANFWWKR